MILPVVKYGDPVLRQKGALIPSVTPDIRGLIQDMFQTMYDARGIGLAAQQVGRAVRLAVIDVREVTDRPSSVEVNGKPVALESFMPLVLINPEFQPVGEPVEGPEGCLSFPEIYSEITRPGAIDVTALNQEGKKIQFRCTGLLARAIQHEVDHLLGILFIDRMQKEKKQEVQEELDALQAATKAALKKKTGKK